LCRDTSHPGLCNRLGLIKRACDLGKALNHVEFGSDAAGWLGANCIFHAGGQLS
jgi:hypothetical protein